MEDYETKIVIAYNINKLLKKQGHSRYWLAKEINGHPSTLADICHGRKICGAGILTRIAKALEVTADDLLKKPRKKTNTALT